MTENLVRNPELEKKLRNRFAYMSTQVASEMIDSLIYYVAYGVRRGDFLMAVLENNFVEAAGRADYQNSNHLKDWAACMYSDMPHKSWGDKEKVTAWIERGGLSEWRRAKGGDA